METTKKFKLDNTFKNRINNSSHAKRLMLRTPSNRNKIKNISLKSLQKTKKSEKEVLKLESKNYLKRRILN